MLSRYWKLALLIFLLGWSAYELYPSVQYYSMSAADMKAMAPDKLRVLKEKSMKLGLDGARLQYVPRSADVLYHTALLEPRKSESIFFEAPNTPGDYPFVCSFPGHAGTMQGVMRVRR